MGRASLAEPAQVGRNEPAPIWPRPLDCSGLHPTRDTLDAQEMLCDCGNIPTTYKISCRDSIRWSRTGPPQNPAPRSTGTSARGGQAGQASTWVVPRRSTGGCLCARGCPFLNEFENLSCGLHTKVCSYIKVPHWHCLGCILLQSVGGQSTTHISSSLSTHVLSTGWSTRRLGRLASRILHAFIGFVQNAPTRPGC